MVVEQLRAHILVHKWKAAKTSTENCEFFETSKLVTLPPTRPFPLNF